VIYLSCGVDLPALAAREAVPPCYSLWADGKVN
jgi:hypothetical protein